MIELPLQGECLGQPYRDFPEELTSFNERKAYQLGVAHSRAVTRDEYNRVIDFAIAEGVNGAIFLDAWQSGDTSDWPEFETFKKAEDQTQVSEEDRRQEVKAIAYKLDPECWVSNSGKEKSFKQAMDIRRRRALEEAEQMYNEGERA